LLLGEARVACRRAPQTFVFFFASVVTSLLLRNGISEFREVTQRRGGANGSNFIGDITDEEALGDIFNVEKPWEIPIEDFEDRIAPNSVTAMDTKMAKHALHNPVVVFRIADISIKTTN